MLSSSGSLVKVACLIVTYNPDIKLLENVIDSVSVQINKIVIVDNNSTNQQEIHSLIVVYPANEFIFIENDQNYGTAKAMNQGVEYLRTRDIEWILFLDQDSVPSKSYISTLFGKIFEGYRGDPRKVMAIRSSETYTNSPVDNDFTASIREIKSSIMSGSVVRMNVFRDIKFREYLFMDFVDTNFYYELRKMGGIYLLYDFPLLEHRIGSQIIIFGKKMNYENPKRVYYMIRNSTVLTLEGRGGLKLIFVGYSPLLLIAIKNGLRVALLTLLKALKDSLFGPGSDTTL